MSEGRPLKQQENTNELTQERELDELPEEGYKAGRHEHSDITEKFQENHLIPAKQADWRDKMNVRIEFFAPPEDIIAPVQDIWEEYI